MSSWLEVSGADDRDYKTARQANKDWLAGVEFKDNTTGMKLTISDVGEDLNVVIRYAAGKKVTNAERFAEGDSGPTETEAIAEIQAEDREMRAESMDLNWQQRHGNRMYTALEWPDSPRPKSTFAEDIKESWRPELQKPKIEPETD